MLLVKDAGPLGFLALRSWPLPLLCKGIFVDPLLPIASSQLAGAVADVFAVHLSQGLSAFDGVIEADKAIACMQHHGVSTKHTIMA